MENFGANGNGDLRQRLELTGKRAMDAEGPASQAVIFAENQKTYVKFLEENSACKDRQIACKDRQIEHLLHLLEEVSKDKDELRAENRFLRDRLNQQSLDVPGPCRTVRVDTEGMVWEPTSHD